MKIAMQRAESPVRSAQKAATAERGKLADKWRSEGASWAEIGRRLGVSKTRAVQLVALEARRSAQREMQEVSRFAQRERSSIAVSALPTEGECAASPLSVRAENCLRHLFGEMEVGGIESVQYTLVKLASSGAVELSRKGLMSLPNMGRKTVEEIRCFLSDFSLDLPPDDSEALSLARQAHTNRWQRKQDALARAQRRANAEELERYRFAAKQEREERAAQDRALRLAEEDRRLDEIWDKHQIMSLEALPSDLRGIAAQPW